MPVFPGSTTDLLTHETGTLLWVYFALISQGGSNRFLLLSVFPIFIEARSLLFPIPLGAAPPCPPALRIALSKCNATPAHFLNDSGWLFITSTRTAYFKLSMNWSTLSPSCTLGMSRVKLQKSTRYFKTEDDCFSLRRQSLPHLMRFEGMTSLVKAVLKES